MSVTTLEHKHSGEPSRSAYQRGCRHPDCVEANALYTRTKRDGGKRAGRRRGAACYWRGCKHDECRAANAEYERTRYWLRRHGVKPGELTCAAEGCQSPPSGSTITQVITTDEGRVLARLYVCEEHA